MEFIVAGTLWSPLAAIDQKITYDLNATPLRGKLDTITDSVFICPQTGFYLFTGHIENLYAVGTTDQLTLALKADNGVIFRNENYSYFTESPYKESRVNMVICLYCLQNGEYNYMWTKYSTVVTTQPEKGEFKISRLTGIGSTAILSYPTSLASLATAQLNIGTPIGLGIANNSMTIQEDGIYVLCFSLTQYIYGSYPSHATVVDVKVNNILKITFQQCWTYGITYVPAWDGWSASLLHCRVYKFAKGDVLTFFWTNYWQKAFPCRDGFFSIVKLI